ncbi:DUF3768 domain-containing protein [Bradyrhizobium sp. 6(2017)]|uniref:DUF3768 domain-containing protein n=1 Tax=Bradyrhizobium sp. 6(2017) TaxID=1197460 RepID=UPI0013E14450|nr:DUF3768 domain-containing protein [Bradyrhizobium sp. 6(2017)]QIG95500.1 DUF3768 domain-containing protein [Bradyrhizobium sp. 6(2017)]
MRDIYALAQHAQMAIAERVRSFEEFEVSNDDEGQTIFGKIDCYDANLKWGSPDPADPAVTRRVLTIMLAEDY